ncbi:hypothetical protein H4582DRAFT_2129896 [Lactarius indigo]|nr:hypothetical protein H4582DRAFT_2129896 [Lactarius indigo]
MSQLLASGSMSQTPATTHSSNIEGIFDAALKSYKKKTKKDIKKHDLFKQLEQCNSPAAVLAAFQVDQFDPSWTGSSDRLKKWLLPAINVLYAFSATLREGVGLVFSPAKVVFAGIGVLLLAAKDVTAGQDVLVDIFERIESFFIRLEIYTGVPLTPAMTEKMVQRTVEVLDIIATATKELEQSRTKKFLKKMVGRTDLEDGLKKLDKLTNDQVMMATVQLLKITHNIDKGLTGVNDDVKAVDDKVQTIAEDGKATAAEVKLILQQTADDVDGVKRKQLRECLRKWRSPLDPSANHNIACDRQHEGTAVWFFEDDIFKEWKATGSLLWVHGKPGSGKSVLCRQPSDGSLVKCLKEMLALPNQSPVYLIMDALDECPDTSDVPSAREQVLDLVKHLVGLRLPNLYITVTSRPEVDIGDALQSLASHTVSLQDECGQKKDIANYVRSVVYSGSGKFMRSWRHEYKEHVIETLSERADGMFRWVYCQLETLRNCLPQNVRRVLRELPRSLDETYERVLKEIEKANPHQAYRLLQCLTVASRPLRVEELTEVLALDLDGAKEGVPALNKDWRWEDQEKGVLSTCSSLITIVYDHSSNTRVIQFAHFSVKEFLTSDRLANLNTDISHFHIRLAPAHTIIAQACLGILLQSESNSVDNEEVECSSPLVELCRSVLGGACSVRGGVVTCRRRDETSFRSSETVFRGMAQVVQHRRWMVVLLRRLSPILG